MGGWERDGGREGGWMEERWREGGRVDGREMEDGWGRMYNGWKDEGNEESKTQGMEGRETSESVTLPGIVTGLLIPVCL